MSAGHVRGGPRQAVEAGESRPREQRRRRQQRRQLRSGSCHRSAGPVARPPLFPASSPSGPISQSDSCSAASSREVKQGLSPLAACRHTMTTRFVLSVGTCCARRATGLRCRAAVQTLRARRFGTWLSRRRRHPAQPERHTRGAAPPPAPPAHPVGGAQVAAGGGGAVGAAGVVQAAGGKPVGWGDVAVRGQGVQLRWRARGAGGGGCR